MYSRRLKECENKIMGKLYMVTDFISIDYSRLHNMFPSPNDHPEVTIINIIHKIVEKLPKL
jgi:hypothetical protein